jgi:AcrR family transcriptional regulator
MEESVMLDRRRCEIALVPKSPTGDPRRRMLDAFVRTAAREGYDRTTIDSVLALADIPEPIFYEHFEDKRDCMLAALDEQLHRIEDAVCAGVEGSTVWSERVRLGLQALLQALAADPEGTRLTLVECLAAGEPAIARLRAAVASCVPTLELGLNDSESAETAHLPPQISEALAGGIVSILHRLALERNTDELPGLLPDLVYFALMPYLGHERALAISRCRSRAGTGSSDR